MTAIQPIRSRRIFAFAALAQKEKKLRHQPFLFFTFGNWPPVADQEASNVKSWFKIAFHF